MRLMNLATLTLAAALLPACGGCGNPDTNEDAGTGGSSGLNRPDASMGVGDGGSSGQPDAGGGTASLAFNGTSPLTVIFGGFSDLSFTMTLNGAPVANTLVQFALSGSGGTLSVMAANTNASGVATTRFTAGNAMGDAVVTASSAGTSNVTVAVRVREEPSGNITLAVTSTTRIPVARADVRLYAGLAGGLPTCAALTANTSTLPATTFTGSVMPIPGNTTFNMVTAGATLAAYATGFNAAGDLIAKGCVEGAVVVGGQTSTVTVPLAQLESVLAGDYDVLMSMDLGNALPQPYEGYVDTVTTMLANPAETAAFYILAQVDGYAGTTFLEHPTANPVRQATLAEVLLDQTTYSTWNLTRNFLHTQLQTRLGETYTNMRNVGADIRRLVTQFEIGSRFQVTAVNGMPSLYQVNESWQAMVFTWQLGCPTGDTGCARRQVQLANLNYAPVSETYNAVMTREALAGPPVVSERYKLVGDPHPVPFRYGRALLIAINQVIIPGVTGCTTCTSMEDAFTFLIGYVMYDPDDTGPLTAVSGCAAVGEYIADLTVPFVGVPVGSLVDATTLAGLCGTGITAAATVVEDQADMLTVGGPPNDPNSKDPQGLNGASQFFLVDQNQDLKTENFRDLQAYVQWVDPANPTTGIEVNSPITGHGREAATGCTSDAACTGARTCQPVAHYLEVALVENTCGKNVGATAGGAACTVNNQCQSGRCTSGTCFRACDTTVMCGGTSMCVDDRLMVDLDATRMGLGDVGIRGCNP